MPAGETHRRFEPVEHVRGAAEHDCLIAVEIGHVLDRHGASVMPCCRELLGDPGADPGGGWVAPLWWTDGVGQADPSHLRLRRT